jgi:hypothetical protein
VDFDADGLADVISGSYSPGDIYLFRKQSDGTYAKGEKIQGADGKPVNAGAASAAYAVDWDGDEDLDLVIGNIQGQVFLVPNEGTRAKPAYGAKRHLEAGGTKIVVGRGDAGPVVADWDADGKPDLIVGGGDGSVLYFRNTSDDKSKPAFAAPQTLVPPSTQAGPGAADDSPLKHGMRMKPHVVDWNGDGKLDLLAGDIIWKENKVELTDEMRRKQQDAEARLAELNVQQRELSKVPADETPDQRKQRMSQLRDVQRQVIEVSRAALETQPRRFENHGYVWLYLRKDVNGKTARAQGGG